MNQNPEIEKLNKKAKEYSKMLKGIHAEMSKVIVGLVSANSANNKQIRQNL